MITGNNTDLFMLYAATSNLYHPANENAVHFFTSVKSDEQVQPRPVSYCRFNPGQRHAHTRMCSGCMLYASSGCDESVSDLFRESHRKVGAANEGQYGG